MAMAYFDWLIITKNILTQTPPLPKRNDTFLHYFTYMQTII
jgi:hypothetical protein